MNVPRRRKRTKYRVLVGMNYEGKRVEPEEVRDDIPEQSVSWLLKQKLIEEVKE